MTGAVHILYNAQRGEGGTGFVSVICHRGGGGWRKRYITVTIFLMGLRFEKNLLCLFF